MPSPSVKQHSLFQLQTQLFFQVAYLTQVNKPLLNIQTAQGKTALHIACENNLYAIARILIENGAKVTCVDIYGRTPLHYACEEIGALLLEKAIDVDSIDFSGKSAASYALLQNKEAYACSLIQKMQNIHVQDCEQDTLLHIATRSLQTKAIALLLEKHADPNCKNKQGNSAFMEAICLGSLPASQPP